MKKSKIAITLTVLALCASLLSGCFGNKNTTESTNNSAGNLTQYETLEPMSQTYFIFDTIVNVKIYDTRATKDNLKDIEDILKNIDMKISRNQETSEISKVIANAGIAPVQVSTDTYDLVSKALSYAERTNGMFDPAIGKLVGLWNIGHEGAHVPAVADIEEALQRCDYRKIEMNDDKHEIYLQEKGMDIDLGSIGKGYAADVIYDYLADKGFHSAIIDLGGNVFAMGSKPGGKKWTIGVQDPDKERGNGIGTIQVEDKTIVTSGIYERFFIEDGKMYQHILDPRTGYPVDNNISSVTIVTSRSTDADALSTTLFVLGIDEGLKFIENTPDAEALFITKDKKLYGTSGFKEMLKKTNDNYTFAN
ncbi:FAD:protein FMN transferase [Paenibacillus segetis]|uniref:FAD:protein FMN transferase n=1 Tax=Paenibacillus segetis TaxID=1325360 RepID=A0ABQ1YVA9_9BACL|nr:FAD:protein FMN transferase [Paenibacillus segetis]GGH37942.1 FAD:protein FMN transferase [Paenibacillus segetis]